MKKLAKNKSEGFMELRTYQLMSQSLKCMPSMPQLEHLSRIAKALVCLCAESPLDALSLKATAEDVKWLLQCKSNTSGMQSISSAANLHLEKHLSRYWTYAVHESEGAVELQTILAKFEGGSVQMAEVSGISGIRRRRCRRK